MSLRRVLGSGVLALGAALLLGACDDINTVSRPTEPVVLTGAQLPDLLGADPGRIVAFRHGIVEGQPVWTQIPVQVDQRKVVPFGSQPASNDVAGTEGTVYGSGSGGPAALQYADPSTFVGADPDPTFDADDELVFMVADAGGKPRDDNRTVPPGVVADSGVAVRVEDPRGENQRGWVHLFRSTGAFDPGAGQDYVDYDFVLASGDYRTTYRRAQGPNPEASRVVTPSYEIDFTDRWKETAWRIRAGWATGVDILDGHKNQFAPTTCGRSNQTFADGEGAFVANIDGPVRAIRSYVGANSGPLTQRTHLLYRDVEHTVTNLRVHQIPSVMDFVDYSDAARGMTYRSSVHPDGVPIDGAADAISTARPEWEAVDGPQGRVYTRTWTVTDVPGLDAATVEFYRDQTTPTEGQCWGDGSYLGASGMWLQATIPNTDPRATPFATLTSHRLTQLARPAIDPANIPASAADWAEAAGTPLALTVTPYRP